MKRREFLKSMTALAAGGVLPAAPAVWSPAKAQARQETLLIVSESGPNNIDIHGVGTNVPGYEVSWNCYDRLISHEMKTLENGTQYYDRDKFKMELADDMKLGDTKQNTAGGGAYRVVSWNAGTEVILERNDKWTGGPLPKVRRIVWRMVPSAGNRRALLERGDADISYDLPNKDFVELKNIGKLNIVSTPYSNGIQYIGMNVKTPPFDNLKVRQAVAYALRYQKIMDAVLFGLAKPMFGAAADAPTEVAWPQPHKFNTDIAKAKALMAEAGYPNGFDTTLSFDLGFAGVNEPLCVLTQESLAQIGIKCTINKIPGATWRTELNKKVLPLYTNVFSGWLDYPEYFFIWCYHGKNSIFNTMSYQSKDMDALIDGAVTAAAEGDKASYDKDVKGFVDLAYADIPRIPLYQPYVNVAMQKNVSGYQY